MKLARFALPAAALFLAAAPASAHTFGAARAGFSAGFMHPMTGWDHLLAMLAVGVWAAQLGGRAIVGAPAGFVLALAAGAALAIAGVPMPAVETGILASLVIAGLLIAFAVRLPLPAGIAIVTLFGLFHGHAHGAEMPQAAAPALYALGFVAASILLHVAGVAIGRFGREGAPALGTRLCGGAVALTGLLALLVA